MGTKPYKYSKEWWSGVLAAPFTCLDFDTAKALTNHRAYIEAFVDGKDVEVLGPLDVWHKMQVPSFTFDVGCYRLASPKPIEVDVAVYWSGETTHHNFTRPAGIRTDALRVDPAHPKAKTLASMEANIPAFKLLSITRVVVDRETHNLMEYTTKLENLGRVPF